MKERELDDEQLRLMQEWLSMRMTPYERFSDVDAAGALRLTEEDCCLLRNFGIAIP